MVEKATRKICIWIKIWQPERDSNHRPSSFNVDHSTAQLKDMTQTGTVISDLNSHFSSLTSAYQGRIKLMNVFYPSERKSVCVCASECGCGCVHVCAGGVWRAREREMSRTLNGSKDIFSWEKITFSDCYQELGFFLENAFPSNKCDQKNLSNNCLTFSIKFLTWLVVVTKKPKRQVIIESVRGS